MYKREVFGVQCLIREMCKAVFYKSLVLRKGGPYTYLIAAIAWVAKQGVSDMFHVRAYLVGASGLQLTGNQRGIPKALDYLVMGGRGLPFTGWVGNHDTTIFRASSERYGDSALFVFDVAPYECAIASSYGVVVELMSKCRKTFLCLADDEQARGPFVDTMNESRTCFVALDHRQVTEMVDKGVDKRPSPVFMGRVDDHGGLFVHDYYVCIFVYNG